MKCKEYTRGRALKVRGGDSRLKRWRLEQRDRGRRERSKAPVRPWKVPGCGCGAVLDNPCYPCLRKREKAEKEMNQFLTRDPQAYSRIVRGLLLSSGIESNPGPPVLGADPLPLPPVPVGWRVTEENNSYIYYTPRLSNGEEYKLTKPNLLAKLVTRGLISPEINLFFSKSKYAKRKKEEEEAAGGMGGVDAHLQAVPALEDAPASKKQCRQNNNMVYECSVCSDNIQDVHR